MELTQVHPGDHSMSIKDYIYRGAVSKMRHLLHWNYPGDNPLVSMPHHQFIAYLYPSLCKYTYLYDTPSLKYIDDLALAITSSSYNCRLFYIVFALNPFQGGFMFTKFIKFLILLNKDSARCDLCSNLDDTILIKVVITHSLCSWSFM